MKVVRSLPCNDPPSPILLCEVASLRSTRATEGKPIRLLPPAFQNSANGIVCALLLRSRREGVKQVTSCGAVCGFLQWSLWSAECSFWPLPLPGE